MCAALLLDAGHALADGPFARSLARHHVSRFEHVQKRARRRHFVRAGREEAVAARQVAGLEAREAHGDDALVEHRHDPAHRTREILARRAPAARLRPRDARDHALEHLRQELRRIARLHAARGEHVLDALLLAHLERTHVNAFAAGEADGGLRGIAVGVEGDLDRGAAERLRKGLGALGHVLDDGDEAARRRMDGYLAMRDAHGVERVRNEAGQLSGRAMQVEGRDLLGADLERERVQVTHGRPPSPPLPRRTRPSRRARCPPRAPCSSHSTPSRACARARCRPCARWPISRRAHRAG